jgi:hypothetical protein
MPNQWLCYAFNGVSVKPTHYSVRTYSRWREHMKNWRLEGSNDGNSWVVLDDRPDNNDLDGQSRAATFSVSSAQVVWKVRIYQWDRNHYDDNYLTLSAFKLFGSLFTQA